MPIADGTTTAPVDSAGVKLPPLYDETNLYLMRRASAANLAATRAEKGLLVALPGEWSITAQPAANTVASATRAAGGAGVRHVLRTINATIGFNPAPAAAVVSVYVRDGASGVGTILWIDQANVEAVAGRAARVVATGLNLVGSANTAMTVEFSAAGGASTFETITATGYDAA